MEEDSAQEPTVIIAPSVPTLAVHYRMATGAIVGFSSALYYVHEPFNGEAGLDWIDHTGPIPAAEITTLTHKVDLETFKVVELSDVEKQQANLPKDFEVAAIIRNELMATDFTQLADRDGREAWAIYRQALRGLLKLYRSHLDQITNWPKRPDGRDPVADLRRRL